MQPRMSKNMNKKIALSRETLRRLDDDSLGQVQGGADTFTCTGPAFCVQPTEYSCDGVIVRTRTCPGISKTL